jgi:hypothetical protein
MEKEVNRKLLYRVTAVLALSSVLFRFLFSLKDSLPFNQDFTQSALMFVGIPTLITVLTIKTIKSPRTAYGMSALVITLFLLLTMVLFGEGFACVLFGAPLFYGAGALVVWLRQLYKEGRDKTYTFTVVVFLFLSTELFTFTRDTTVQSVSDTVRLSKELSTDVFAKKPDFMKDFPKFFKLGFPKPQVITGEGLKVGDMRSIPFLSKTRGEGDLVLKITKITDNQIEFTPIKDNTHIAHWLTWKKVTVDINNETGAVTWTSDYTCDLGPSWYFKPIEKYAVHTMNQHLIHSYFEND